MKERKIIYSREKHDARDEPIAPERLAELFPEREIFKFWGFVENLRKENRKIFCVSRQENKTARDPDLLFFGIGEVVVGEYPQITFLGKQMGKGGIGITSKFAAETHGYWVLQLGEKKQDENDK